MGHHQRRKQVQGASAHRLALARGAGRSNSVSTLLVCEGLQARGVSQSRCHARQRRLIVFALTGLNEVDANVPRTSVVQSENQAGRRQAAYCQHSDRTTTQHVAPQMIPHVSKIGYKSNHLVQLPFREKPFENAFLTVFSISLVQFIVNVMKIIIGPSVKI